MYLLSLLLLSLCVEISTCYNVDTSEAIWFQSADPNSYFGYSVNLYRNRNNPSMRYVLIGAPRANSSSELFQTGNTFRCEALEPNSCTPLNLPGLSEANHIDSSDVLREIKDNMWMGVSVDSSYVTGAVVTCGHRYVTTQSSDRRDLIGRCYTLRDATAVASRYEPCAASDCSIDPGIHDYCMAGFSAEYLEDGSQLYVGAPGVKYYRGSPIRGYKTNSCESGFFRQKVDYFGYLGYAMTSGRLFNQQRDVVVVSAPRENKHLGNIFLFENNTETYLIPQFIYHGTTHDSYYGFSMLAVDLNGDGLDELLVSAPMYSLPGQTEIGQVHIYSSNGNSLRYAAAIIRQDTPYSRFGTALADLGDLDKDGYPEVAISAPYGDQAGTVYIYSGTSQGLLSSAPIQIIRGEDVGLGKGAAFGAAVSGKQDMDNNGYNDILVGAYVNSSAFLLRTLPVATIVITPSSAPQFAIIDLAEARVASRTQNLTFNNIETEYIYFTLILPVSFHTPDGKPDTMQLLLNVTADANEATKNPRVFFVQNNVVTNVYMKEMMLEQTQPNELRLTVFLKENRNFLRPIPFDFEYSAVNPSQLDFNTSLAINNLKGIPRYEVQPNLNCGEDRICIPDLRLVAYAVLPTLPSDPNRRYGHIVAGEVKEFNISVEVSNGGEDSFGTSLQLTIPRGVTYRITYAEDRDIVIGCRIAQTVTQLTTLSCFPLGNPLKGYNSSTVRFSVVFNSDALRGDEGSLDIELEVLSSNSEANTTRYDNKKIVSIGITASADIATSLQVLPKQLAFNESTKLRINHLINTENQTEIFHTDLGPEVTYLFLVSNNGPSPIFNTTLDIHWPFGLKNLDRPTDRAATHFFLYPTKYQSDKIRCDSTYFNVAELRESRIVIDEGETTPDGRKTRSIEYSEDGLYVQRGRRETDVEPTDSSEKIVFNTDISCVDYHEYCVTIKCKMGEIPPHNSYELRVTANVFEATLAVNAPASIWKFTVFSEVFIKDEHVVQPDNNEPDNSRVELKLIPSSLIGGNEGFTRWWIILLAILAFLIIMIPLVVSLYFCGFFKKHLSNNAKLEQSRVENMQELMSAAKPDFS